MEFINKIFALDFFKNLPVGWQIVFAFFLILLAWFTIMLKSKNFRMFISQGFTKTVHYFKNEDLLMHSIFFSKKRYINQLSNIDFGQEHYEKTKIFRMLLEEVINSSIDLPREWLVNNQEKRMTPVHLRNSLDNLVYKIIADYEVKIKLRFNNEYGKEVSESMFALIYHSDNGFKRYHKERLEFIFRNINRVVNSQAKNINDSIRTILTQIDISIDLAILDCEMAFTDLNGRIENSINQNNK